MRLSRAWKRHALSMVLLTAVAGATVTSPPEKRQASITAVSECHMDGTAQHCMVGTTEYRVVAEATPTTDLASSYTDCHAHAAETWCMNPNGGEVEVIMVITAVTDCYLEDTQVHCFANGIEYRVDTVVTATADLPPTYTGCHTHSEDTYCLSPSGDDVQIQLASEEDEGGHESGHEGGPSAPVEENCHFHAGVEHCVGGSREEGPRSCERRDRDYNVPLRIGLLFAILVTSSIGVFVPILLAQYLSTGANTALLIVKQFGTGVILSTALVHLFTHAELMFGNECLGGLKYEATTAAILMAGLFLSFLVEYIGYRVVKRQTKKAAEKMGGNMASAQGLKSLEMVSVYIMEAGIIFHSLIIGITLVVSGDSFLLTLFVVIIFHQMFEGLALGSRIAALGTGTNSAFGFLGHNHGPAHPTPVAAPIEKYTDNDDATTTIAKPKDSAGPQAEDTGAGTVAPLFHVSMAKKIALASAFALVTPVGMAIGIGVLDVFNGNDPKTIVAIGVLDAFSAGILLWVGVVEMWAADWVYGGGMADASALVTCLGMGGLVSGMVIMSVLGKWA